MKRVLAVGIIALALAACGGQSNGSSPSAGQSDHTVAEDLQSLMGDNNITGTVYSCTHQSGNSYVCQVGGTSQGTLYPTVTDDGSSVYEQGLPKS